VDKANGYLVGYIKKGADGAPDEIHHVADVDPSKVAPGGRSNHYAKSVIDDLRAGNEVKVGPYRDGLAHDWGTKSNDYRDTGNNPDNELALLNRPNERT
jgi:hypothetical protein